MDFLNGFEGLGVILAVILGIAVVLFAMSRAARLYRKVPPSKVMVIYGRGTTKRNLDKTTDTAVRLVTGGGSIVWPIIEEFEELDLTVMQIEQPRDRVYTIDGLPLDLDWNALVQIGTDDVSLLTAATAFLGKDSEEIINIITKTLSTNNRAIVGQLSVEQLHRDRDQFVQKVQQLAADEMSLMGLKIIQMGVKDITDEEGYFDAMAAPKIAAVKRDAKIAQAEADRDAQVKSAAARLAGEQADVAAQTTIIEKRQELELRQVEQQRTVQLRQAAADQEVQTARALVVEKQQEVELLVPARAKKEAAVIEAESQQQQLQIGAETEKKVKLITADASAEAKRTEAKGQADALTTSAIADAEARTKKAKAEAEATKATGEAEAARLTAIKRAEAEGVQAAGLAAAASTEAQLLAEAKGKRELADATAAQGEINLRQAIAEAMLTADVQKAEAIAKVLAGIGGNVRIVQLSGNEGSNGSGQPNGFVGLLQQLPELLTVLNSKTEALTGGSVEDIFKRVMEILNNAQKPASSEGTEEN